MSAIDTFFSNFHEDVSVDFGQSRDAMIYVRIWNLLPHERTQMISELRVILSNQDYSKISTLAEENFASAIYYTDQPEESTEKICEIAVAVVKENISDWDALNSRLLKYQ